MGVILQKTLIFLEYLETGLIPVNGFHKDDVESFELMLLDLSETERRKVNRKFRKVFRSICKRELSNPKRPTTGWAHVYGIGSPKPTPKQLRARRRLVHEEIRKSVESRLKNA